MDYKCKHCGWTPKSNDSSFHTTSEDLKEIFDHEKNKCPNKRDVYDGTYR